jgi:hypothetical protein
VKAETNDVWASIPKLTERGTPMKNLTNAMAGIVLLVALGVGSSQAQNHAYTKAVLSGCYGFLSNSVDSKPSTATVGTICFDGQGNIVSNAGGLDQTGWLTDTTVGNFFTSHEGGTYNVGNAPGQGMGTMTFANGCTYYFSMNNVFQYNIALGFQFVLYNYESCKEENGGDPKVVGGTAYIQP